MLNEINKALSTYKLPVYYGMLPSNVDINEWNYFVFRRKTMNKNGTNNCDFTDYYQVAIVQENYIPEGYIDSIIDNLLKIKGLKLASNEYQYDYVYKPKTELVCEVIILEFAKARKRVEE